jgi:hypothetical protein
MLIISRGATGASFVIGGYMVDKVITGGVIGLIMTFESMYCLYACNRDNTREI